uniref:NADH dehydrogenase subunit 6 n=1 Tax=Neopsylla specialis TaxID=129382 RepID=UPI002410D58E|nr:NADH dehydrogenase subunit 6 [Neopsylla specialis]WEQ92387.1 NADH dehydrogenase subunit 6 [Neopsylla specialis]
MLFLSFGLILSLIFSQMTHPLALGFLLMIQTLWISMIIGNLSKTFWFSYILFLTFLGGMLILFIYMTSLSQNDIFNFSFKKMMLITLSLILILSAILLIETFYFNDMSNMDTMLNFDKQNIKVNILNVNKLFNFPNNMITIMSILYLLMALIVVIKITDIKYGPLRKNF